MNAGGHPPPAVPIASRVRPACLARSIRFTTRPCATPLSALRTTWVALSRWKAARKTLSTVASGIALPPMSPLAPSMAELDAMFGVAGAGAHAECAAPLPEDRSAALHARMRAAFAADLPRRRAELRAAVERRDLDAVVGQHGGRAHVRDAGLAGAQGEIDVLPRAGDRLVEPADRVEDGPRIEDVAGLRVDHGRVDVERAGMR